MADILGHASLGTNLEAYWQMEETSGTRYDSHNSYNLTDNNTVLSGTGILGTGADMESTNNEYLSVASNSIWDWTTSNDRSLSMWIKTESDITNQGLCVRWSNEGGNNKNLLVRLNASGYVQVYVGSGSSTGVNVTGSTDVSDQAWHHIVITWNGTVDDKFRIYVDGSLDATSATASPGAASSTLRFGGYSGGSGTAFDGIIDEVGWWSKALTSTEVTALYNSGAGLPYIDASDVANSYLNTDNEAYWEMEETSGTRTDSSANGFDLTDNNTVGSATGIQGTGADFEATNSEYLSRTVVDLTPSATISAWVKFESNSTLSYLCQGGTNDADTNYRVEINGNALGFRRESASGIYNLATTPTLSTGTWYHIVCIHDTSNGAKVYVNGVIEGSDANGGNLVTNNTTLAIAARDRGSGGQNFLDGIIDEFGMWNRPLSHGEIMALYNGGTGIPYSAATPSATFTPKTVMF